jgi:hypothetical protein
MAVDKRLVQVLGDRRFRCFMRLLRGKECKLVDIDPDRLLEGSAEEIEKVYRLLPELDVRKSGYDIVGRLVELGRRLKSESVRDLTAAVALMFSVMFGQQLSEEDARRIGEVVEAFKCIKVDEDGVEVDGECLNSVNVPEELKDQIRSVSMVNLVWS